MDEDVTFYECPNCGYDSKFYHLDWHAVVCQGCDVEVTLKEYRALDLHKQQEFDRGRKGEEY